MAVIKTGSIVADIRGKIGDEVYTRGQGGAAVRSIGTWAQPDTDLQLAVRAIMVTLSGAWSSTLSEDQREQWRAYAHANPRPNRWGTLTQTSGYLAFVRHNFHAYREASTIIFPDAPTAPPLYPPNIGIKVQQDGALFVTGTLTPDATGTYYPAGEYAGHPYWQGSTAAGTWHIWYDAGCWLITAALGDNENEQWYRTIQPTGTYAPSEGATGTATAAWSYAGSLAKFTFPPTNYPDPSPFLQLYTYSGKPLCAGRKYYNSPWSILATFVPPTPATSAAAWRRWTWPTRATGTPYAWPIDGSGTARAYAIIQDMLTGARSTRHLLTPEFGSLTPW